MAVIYRAILANCITTLRAGESYLITPPVREIQPTRDVLVRRGNPLIVVPFSVNLTGENIPDQPAMDAIPNEDIYVSQECILSSHAIWRPFSLGTSSFNKIIELEHVTGFYFYGLKRIGIACLGEG